MTNDELLDIVYARIGSERDSGILAPVILKAAQEALESTSRYIAMAKPLNHERLIQEKIATSSSTIVGNTAVLLTDFDDTNWKLIVEDKFAFVTVYDIATGESTGVRAVPVKSLDGLRLAEDSGIVHYHVKPPYIFFGIPSTLTINRFKIRHYVIPLSLSYFPTQLREHLIQSVLNILLPDIQNKNAKENPKAS